MIVIIGLPSSNVRSILNMLKKIGVDSSISEEAETISKAGKIIMPGVGTFDKGMNFLKSKQLDLVIKEKAKCAYVKILGICLGMQMLGDRSEEGQEMGLGIIPGGNCKFSVDLVSRLKVPHMGWNNVIPKKKTVLFDSFPEITSDMEQERFYFAHSYWFNCENKENIVATTHYGIEYPSVIWNGRNVYGVQFHPEKSHRFGLELLRKFATC